MENLDDTAIDLLHRLIDRIFDAGRAAGRAEALAGRHRQEVGDGPGGVSWERIVRHAEANGQRLSVWERELVDSVSCSFHYGIELTPRQKAKLEWIFHNRFGGRCRELADNPGG